MSVVCANMLYMQHDWFADLTGFRETSYDDTRQRLVVAGDTLASTVNGKRYGIGTLELPTLAALRARLEATMNGSGMAKPGPSTAGPNRRSAHLRNRHPRPEPIPVTAIESRYTRRPKLVVIGLAVCLSGATPMWTSSRPPAAG